MTVASTVYKMSRYFPSVAFLSFAYGSQLLLHLFPWSKSTNTASLAGLEICSFSEFGVCNPCLHQIIYHSTQEQSVPTQYVNLVVLTTVDLAWSSTGTPLTACFCPLPIFTQQIKVDLSVRSRSTASGSIDYITKREIRCLDGF